MTIFFGADRNGDPQKSVLLEALCRHGVVTDVIEKDPALSDYVLIADRVAQHVAKGDGAGVLLCGTGSGMSIVANKRKGVYAVRCMTPQDAKDAKRINNAHVLCLSAQTQADVNKAIIDAFFETSYAGRKPERLEAIRRLEERYFL